MASNDSSRKRSDSFLARLQEGISNSYAYLEQNLMPSDGVNDENIDSSNSHINPDREPSMFVTMNEGAADAIDDLKAGIVGNAGTTTSKNVKKTAFTTTMTDDNSSRHQRNIFQDVVEALGVTGDNPDPGMWMAVKDCYSHRQLCEDDIHES